MIDIYFFGNIQECEICENLFMFLLYDGVFYFHDKNICNFMYIDAFADETQDFCDEMEVEDIPHVKVYKNGRLILNKVYYSLDDYNLIMNVLYDEDCTNVDKRKCQIETLKGRKGFEEHYKFFKG